MKKSCLMLTCFLGAIAARTADDGLLQSKVYRRIKADVDRIRMIDTHEHLGSEAAYLKRPPDALPDWIKRMRRRFLDRHVPKGADGQVVRVAGRFALVSAAGELAAVGIFEST